jgi:hypothetical protein
MICPACRALHFDGAFARCEDCRAVVSMEEALTEKEQITKRRPILMGSNLLVQPNGGAIVASSRVDRG